MIIYFGLDFSLFLLVSVTKSGLLAQFLHVKIEILTRLLSSFSALGRILVDWNLDVFFFHLVHLIISWTLFSIIVIIISLQIRNIKLISITGRSLLLCIINDSWTLAISLFDTLLAVFEWIIHGLIFHGLIWLSYSSYLHDWYFGSLFMIKLYFN